ncbi:UDP-glycosyltransferase 88F4-like [Macadamia integrifolia]|uniref:UDP-glycosyltransferase 88F4-like n=1 Tax=Macadamia integrifolia TaxID=60698 RepID=UPI001C4EEA1C|nr:UDP-glycosyltransferase 88F4-like [Macadamia integrifolia]
MATTIVLYPAPGIGHVVSMVELGKLILHHHHHHFAVVILVATGPFDTSATTSYINHISQTYPSITFHHFPSLPFQLSLKPSPTRSYVAILCHFIRLNNHNLLQALQSISETTTIRSLIVDFFCPTAIQIAADHGIPTYCFFTSGAAFLAALLYFRAIHNQTIESFKEMKMKPSSHLHFPGLPSIPLSSMPEVMRNPDDEAYHDGLYISDNLPNLKGIVVNTFASLEPKVIRAIEDGLCVPDGPTPPVYYIGPVIANPKDRIGDGEAMYSRSDCLSWLDNQPSRSVVFLCFGSRGSFSLTQLEEIAVGLEKSGHRFLWVVRNPLFGDNIKQILEPVDPDLELLLPDGFLDRTKKKGLVVTSWAPQIEVLNHESVGGFVTHCGWNSVLESVCAGVPMVAWPLYAEQHMNKEVLVEDMKLAMPMEASSEDGFVSSAEVEKRVRSLMESEEGRVLRERGKDFSRKALAVWAEDGSSFTTFTELVESWKL